LGFHKFFLIPSEKGFLVASLTSFALRQFLERIVTANETWVYHYEPEGKAQSTNWKRQTLPVTKKFKSQPSAGKIMRTLFLGYGRCDFGSFHSEGSISRPQLFPYVWVNERSSKRKIFIIGAVQNLLKTRPKNFFFSGGIIKKLMKS
jgi:hypothetical protein